MSKSRIGSIIERYRQRCRVYSEFTCSKDDISFKDLAKERYEG